MSASLRPARPSAPARQLWTFHGGLHLPDEKAPSTRQPIRPSAIPGRLVLPIQQHIGSPPEILVAPGDEVLKGQLLARPEGYVSAALHAPSSGKVVEIAEHPVPHPSGLSAPCIVIETDGRDQWAELPAPLPDFEQREPSTLRERVRWAGVVGLGGAAFPSSVKLTPAPGRRIHTLILNGAECEPYISCDDMLMRERPDRILDGLRVLRHILGAERCLIGIEDNKPQAIAAMGEALRESGLEGVELVTIPTLYPSGGEKQLIRVLTGQEVPSHGIPAEIGFVCQNVGTAAAVGDAVLHGRPLISRIVTLAGPGMAEPQNREVLIGTPAETLIAQCGGYADEVSGLVLGGPMMGFALSADQVPLTKGTNCLLAITPASSPDPGPPRACIRCGECAAVCPVSLLPQQLYWYARAKDFDRVQDYDLFDCIECGCCAHVCPSHIPLVQYYRFAKTEIWALEEDRRKAEHARQRHEARVSRLERLEQERKARLRKRKEALAGGKAAAGKDPKKAAIEAAMKRVAEKKAAQAKASSTETEEAQSPHPEAAPGEQASANDRPRDGTD
jgi:electron transport complex protein RnfC